MSTQPNLCNKNSNKQQQKTPTMSQNATQKTSSIEENSRRADSYSDAQKTFPNILTVNTEATDVSTESDWTDTPDTVTPKTLCTPSFTPINGSHDCFRTPTNQTIRISYESLGLTTTTKMRSMRDVLSEMEDDGVWELEVLRPNIAFRLLVFLYGKGYYADLSRLERISCMRQCITKVGENRKRLAELAFSGPSDRILAAENGFDCYFYMASTARMLFSDADAKRGFPFEVYYRIQASKNCYVVAVCMWLTIKLQRDYPNRNQLPIDVGYIGRRHVIDTQEGLEQRVIQDKGFTMP
jgi:hypothetical protein